jgi:hypothetical protein
LGIAIAPPNQHHVPDRSSFQRGDRFLLEKSDRLLGKGDRGCERAIGFWGGAIAGKGAIALLSRGAIAFVSAKGDRGFVGQSEKNDDRVFVEESDLWKRAIAEKGAITFWERGNLVLLENGDRVFGRGAIAFWV